MRIASTPLNEELRLQDLYSYDILDSEWEKDFDDLLEVAAKICGCPIAAITFIDKDRQWLKAKKGIEDEVSETSRDIAFCAHTILEKNVLIVKDATLDERFCDNPVVTGGLLIRFYAGAPIVSKAGYKLGSVCVIDNQPREFTEAEAKALSIISGQISKLLELRLKNKLLKQKAEEQLQLEKLLLQKTLQEYEKERFSISTELHENIAQGLAATKFYLEIAEESGMAKDDLIRKSKENIMRLVRQVIDLSKAIAPSILKNANLQELLQELLSQFYNQSGIEAKLKYEGREEVPHDSAIKIYRIVEALLENIKQHSGATNVVVNVNVCEAIYLSVEDNGIGLDIKSFIKGVGINKIISHVEHLGGHMSMARGNMGGCSIIITIPMQKGVEKSELLFQ